MDRQDPFFQPPAPPASTANGLTPPSIPPAPDNILQRNDTTHQKVLIQDVPSNIWLPDTLELTFYELLAFLPTMLQIPLAIHRLLRNGATRRLMESIQLLAARELTAKNVKTVMGRIKYQVHDAISTHFGTKSGKETQLSQAPFPDRTTATWRTRLAYKSGNNTRGFFGHVKLRDLYMNISPRQWPTGNDRGHLTLCLEYDRQDPGQNLYTSHIPWILEKIQPPPPRQQFGSHTNADEEDIASWLDRDWAQLEEDAEDSDSDHESEQAQPATPEPRVEEQSRLVAFSGYFHPAEPAVIASMNEFAVSTGLLPDIYLDHYPSEVEMVTWLRDTFPDHRLLDRIMLSRLWHFFLWKQVPANTGFMQALWNAYHGIIRGG